MSDLQRMLASTPLEPAPFRLVMSPDGHTIVTEDHEKRLRFFDLGARCVRKQRFNVPERFPHMVLEDAFCAFGGTEGRVILQDGNGTVVCRRKVGDAVERLDSLERAVAVYSTGGRCIVMGPYGNLDAVFDAPPGQYMVRAPHGGEPRAAPRPWRPSFWRASRPTASGASPVTPRARQAPLVCPRGSPCCPSGTWGRRRRSTSWTGSTRS